jgi:hypothetical protein
LCGHLGPGAIDRTDCQSLEQVSDHLRSCQHLFTVQGVCRLGRRLQVLSTAQHSTKGAVFVTTMHACIATAVLVWLRVHGVPAAF